MAKLPLLFTGCSYSVDFIVIWLSYYGRRGARTWDKPGCAAYMGVSKKLLQDAIRRCVLAYDLSLCRYRDEIKDNVNFYQNHYIGQKFELEPDESVSSQIKGSEIVSFVIESLRSISYKKKTRVGVSDRAN